MAFWSAANLSEDCNITSDFHEYFDKVYDGACMEHHNSLKHCSFPWFPCDVTSYRKSSDVHRDVRYTDSSLAWVLIAAIIVFFMKAGFMQLEIAFAKELDERRSIVIYKYMDACASAFGFFLIGFDYIARYRASHCIQDTFFDIYDPVLWFFKFTFASNAATILGGCLVTNKYKLRLPAVFVSAFVISGIIHPLVAYFIWSDSCTSVSPYRFCKLAGCHLDCSSYFTKAYFLDFAGGGAVHLLGGTAGLMVCLFAKLQKYIDEKNVRLCWPLHHYYQTPIDARPNTVAQGESADGPEGFWDTMYSDMGAEEFVHSSALGVLILWFAWFAFNCGSTESVEGGEYGTYHAVPARIAINMIMCCAAGGLLAIAIASWAQLTYGFKSVNANEVSNGILSCLVAITASCPYVNYWSACMIGIIAVIVYHLGCYAEYKLGIEDTAKVVPVHGVCGLWSLVAVGLFVQDLPLLRDSLCYLHATFEGLCYCSIRLPYLNWIERFGAQIIGAVLILLLGISSGLVYGILYIIPVNVFVKLFCCRSRVRNLYLHGGLLLTSPYDKFVSDSGGIPTRTQQQPRDTSINTTEETPLLADVHTPRENISEPDDLQVNITHNDTVQEGPSSRRMELLDPVGRGGYATFSGKSNREKYSVKKDVTV